jgi:hypothetical protein
MKSSHILKTIVVVPAPPLDGKRNSKGVKKYRKVEKTFFVFLLFHTSTIVRAISWRRWNYYVSPERMTRAAILIGLCKMSLLLFYAPCIQFSDNAKVPFCLTCHVRKTKNKPN